MRSRALQMIALPLAMLTAAGAHATEVPVAVSPGDASKLVVVESRCPTFSWAGGEEAKSYELVVYRVGTAGEEAEAVLRQSFPAPAYSWTPSLDLCLERGGQFAWSVRALGPKEASEWSAPSLFEVASGPSEAEFEAALQVVRRSLEGTGPASRRVTSVGGIHQADLHSSPSHGDESPTPLASASGEPDLQVNGASVITTATIAGDLCGALGYRYMNQGDGTILDCNTGKMWLRDAACLGADTWDLIDDTSIFTKVEDFNNGTDFGCQEYEAGTYSDWRVPNMVDLCGSWDGSCIGTSCCAAEFGIIDTAFADPAGDPVVADAQGDSPWSEGDPFYGLNGGVYWSADGIANDFSAWCAELGNGSVYGTARTFQRQVWPVRGPE